MEKTTLADLGVAWSRGLGTLGLFLIGPIFFDVFFIIGLRGIALTAALVVLIISFTPFLLLRANPVVLNKLKSILQIPLGALMIVAGLLNEFEFDPGSVPTALTLTLIVFLAFTIGLFDLVTDQESGRAGMKIRILGTGLVLGLLSLVGLIGGGFNWFLYGGGMAYLVGPIIYRQVSVQLLEKPQSLAPGLRVFKGIWYFLAMLGTGLGLGFFLYLTITRPSPAAMYGYLGLGVGLTAGFFYTHRSWALWANWIIGMGGLVAIYLVFATNPTIVDLPLIALVLGSCVGAMTQEWIHMLFSAKLQSMRSLGVAGFLWLALVAGSGVLASQIKWLVRDNPAWLLYGIPIFIVVFVITIGLYILLQRVSNKQLLRTLQSRQVLGNARGVAVIALCCLIACPLLVMGLSLNSRRSVTITLDQTYYTVTGEPVTEITLPAKTALILLKQDPNAQGLPSPAGNGGNEYIRPGKSVRLGAYFYGGTENITSAEAMDWIANNMDVLSVGGWLGWFMNKSDVLMIKAKNPAGRVYGMVFATTYWEDSRNNHTDGTLTIPWSWGVAWNETMHNWTLKQNDGTEIYGVRHGAGSAYDHIMDLGNMEWADYFAWFFTKRAEDFAVNGMAIDEVMWNGYWGTDEKDLRDYSSVEEIKATCYKWLERVDQKTDMEIITQAFWPAAQQYQQGVWGEAKHLRRRLWGRVDDRNQTIFYEGNTWMGIVDNMYTMALANKSYIWAAWYNQTDPAAPEYCIATYLMGKPNNCSWLGFHPQPIWNGGYPNNLAGYDIKTVRQEVVNHPELFDLEMGDALGQMYLMDGRGGQAWRRDFKNGIVLVNPYHAQIPGFESNNAVWLHLIRKN